MDLRCRLEHNERDWLREKAELLERFDTERRKWESQLKDMRRKIEELYCEVRVKREGIRLDGGRQDNDDDMLHLSTHSTSTGSSLLSDHSGSEPLSNSSQSDPNRHQPLPGFDHNSNISDGECGVRGYQHSTYSQGNSLGDPNVGGQFAQDDHLQPELVDELRSRNLWQKDSKATDSKEVMDMAELEAFFQGASGRGGLQRNDSVSKENEKESPVWTELSYCSDKKKNNTALNAALKEIARVSKELCSYQDQIRKKTGDKRNQSEEKEILLGHKTRLEVDEAPCDLNEIYDDFRALERENWISLTPDNTWQAKSGPVESLRSNSADPDSYRDKFSEMDTEAPPIPPRTSSWNLSTPSNLDTELHIPESPVATTRKCHSPCVLVDKKCNSPSIVRKFEAMLQENEGKVLIDGVVASCPVPTSSNCNVGCCHNRWSCDVSKFSNTKLSTYGTVQKSFSEVNILTAGKGLRSDYNLGAGNVKSAEGHHTPLVVKEIPVDLLMSSLEIPPAIPNLQGSKRNIMLELKTAEFNRTLFQAEMGHGVAERDSFTLTDASSVGFQPVSSTVCAADEVLPPRDAKFDLQPQCGEDTSGITSEHPEVTLLHSKIQNPEVQLRRTRSGHEGQEIRAKQKVLSDLSPEQSELETSEATMPISQSPTDHSEVKHKVRTASSPSRKTQQRAATDALFSEPGCPANTQPAQSMDGSSSKDETPHGGRPHSAKVSGSPQQLSAENKSRETTQPGHQAQPKQVSATPSQFDSSRLGPRVMNDHPWKPLTLAAYPRPEGSRSNYGAVERILKNYESAVRAQQNQNQRNQLTPSPDLSLRQKDNITELDMLDMDPLPLPATPRHTQSSHSSQSHTTQAQLSSHSAMGRNVKEMKLAVQGQEDYRWNT
ncbi:hypothetical protein LDENG_00056770 [Lucifuga dentata]|nr:hypothetical protein LDENG_00056770 [Lucifuga dentata]